MTASPDSISRSELSARGTPIGPRVVVASSGLGHVARGVEAWAADLAAALASRGVNVTLCKGGGAAITPYEKVIGCIQRGSAQAARLARFFPQFLGWRLGANSTYGVEQITFAMNLLRFLRRERVDILHVQDPQVALIVQRAQSIGLVRTRSILAHGTEEPVTFLNKITYLQHLAPWHEEECRNAGATKPAWTSIPNFIDTDRFTPGSDHGLRAELGIPAEGLVVVTAAAIKRKHKRIDVLIEEFAQLLADNPELPAWLVIAGGEEADTQGLIAHGRQLLGDRVRFLVRYPRARMADLYRCADVFVLNSLKEMMPIAVLEAAASGVPCIVHKHPVLTWMVGPGGKATDLSVTGALSSSLRPLLANSDCRRRLGTLARDHCMAHFGEPAVVGQILGYYDSVLKPTRQTTGRPPADLLRGAQARTSTVVAHETVSVVIPTFNSSHWVVQAVESVLAQTVQPTEIIVVDDGSTDDTRQRLSPYLGRIRYVLQRNAGVARARNHGISQCTGSLVAFLDADDIWHPRKLELQLKALASHPDLALLGTATFDWPTEPSQELGVFDVAPTALPWRQLVVKNRLTTSSVIVRRSALTRAGVFDEALHGPEDFDLWLRIAETGPVANLNAPLTGYRTVPGSLGRRVSTMEAGLGRILEKLDQRGSWRGRWVLRRKAHSYCRYSCAYLHLEAGNQREALQRILSSLASYPIPYQRSEVRMPLARVRMLMKALRRVLHATARPKTA